MKTKTLKKDKVNIVTLGCSKNIVDSEVILTQLKGNQIDAQHESKKDDSNIVIINTCGFIDNAKQESIDTILLPSISSINLSRPRRIRRTTGTPLQRE